MDSNNDDPAWAYTKGAKNIMMCCFCNKRLGGGITRVKYHLAGLKRHNDNNNNIEPCNNVPKSVQIEMVSLLSSSIETGLHINNTRLKKIEPCNNVPKIVQNEMITSVTSPKEKGTASTGPSTNLRKRTHKRYNSDNDLDTNMFESLLGYIWCKLSEEKRESCIYLDSLWFSLYRDELKRNKVLDWIKKKDIFSKKYIFVPIVCWGHWNLLILCNFGGNKGKPCMMFLDSLLDMDPKRLEKDIRSFIFDIYEIKEMKKDKKFIQNIPLLVPKVPQQTNGTECGFYVLYYIYRFIESAPVTFTIKDYPYFLTEEWFSEEEFESFCLELGSYSKNKGTASENPNPNSDNTELDDETPLYKLRKIKSKSPKKLKKCERKKNLKDSIEPCSTNARLTRSSFAKKTCGDKNKEPNEGIQRGSQSSSVLDARADSGPISNSSEQNPTLEETSKTQKTNSESKSTLSKTRKQTRNQNLPSPKPGIGFQDESKTGLSNSESKSTFSKTRKQTRIQNLPSPKLGINFQDESKAGFSIPDLVWGKVRSHPWWPGQIFDPSDASDLALKHRNKNSFLVAYFGDRTFAWIDSSVLKPFQTNFSSMDKQSKAEGFVAAVDASLAEVSRRVGSALSCSCHGSDIGGFKVKIDNAGIKSDACSSDGDVFFVRNSFDPAKFFDFLSDLSRSPSLEAERLDLVIAKAQLKAFNQFRGISLDLPEFNSINARFTRSSLGKKACFNVNTNKVDKLADEKEPNEEMQNGSQSSTGLDARPDAKLISTSSEEPISISKNLKKYARKKNLEDSLEPWSPNARRTRSSLARKKACFNKNKVDKSEVEKEPNEKVRHGSRSSTNLDERADADPIFNNQQESALGTECDLIEPNPTFYTNLTRTPLISNELIIEPNSHSNPNDPSIEANPNSNSNTNQSSIEANPNGFSIETNPDSSTNPNGSSVEPIPNESFMESNLDNPSWFSLSEDSPIQMTNSISQYLNSLNLSKWAPQRPHFKTLESDWQQMREGKALGMIITYVNLKQYLKNPSFDDDVVSFREKMKYLDSLEDNGFSVDSMRTYLKKLIEIKCRNISRSRLTNGQEKELVHRKSDDDKAHMILDQIGTGLIGSKRRVWKLTAERSGFEEERESLTSMIAEKENDIMRMRNMILHPDSEKFDRCLAEFVRG